MRSVVAFALTMSLLVLAGCGGSGTSSSSSSSSSIPSGAGLNPGSGGNSSGNSGSSASSAPNVALVTVELGPNKVINQPVVSVTVCVPNNPSQCQTIDRVLVDTGSYGLRVLAGTLKGLTLPGESDASGNAYMECAQFAAGFTWGPVVTADVKIAGESAANIPMQVITQSQITQRCEDLGTPFPLYVNGILGVGPMIQDCGSDCVTGTDKGLYYSCTSTSCESAAIALASQVRNPAASFATDNNGIILQLPAVADAGAKTITGTLVFGIGTQGNNDLGAATVLTGDSNTGYIKTQFQGNTYYSILDSGSNESMFPDNQLPLCSSGVNSFFCPSSSVTLTAVNLATNGITSTVSLSVGNATALWNAHTDYAAFDNVAAANSSSLFDFGLPFFYGKSVFIGFAGRNSSGGVGPFYAY